MIFYNSSFRPSLVVSMIPGAVMGMIKVRDDASKFVLKGSDDVQAPRVDADYTVEKWTKSPHEVKGTYDAFQMFNEDRKDNPRSSYSVTSDT